MSRKKVPPPHCTYTRGEAGERPLSADEKRIVDFLRQCVDHCMAQVNSPILPKLAADAHDRAVMLSAVADAIEVGRHDRKHPTRAINLHHTIEVIFGQIPKG
jgi:hypothetical protein